MKVISSFFAFALIIFSVNANAASIKGGYPVCLSEDDLSEFVTNHARTIAEGRCAMPKRGADIVVLSGFLTLKIRLYLPSGKSVIVFTPSENVDR